MERGRIGPEIGVLENLENLQNLELIDFELRVGFGQGFVKLKNLKKILLIPSYKEEVMDHGGKGGSHFCDTMCAYVK